MINVKENTLLYKASSVNSIYHYMLILMFTVLTAVSAAITIPLPFTPVPITGHTFMVLLSGAVLGRYSGSISQFLYVGLGCIGLPLFASSAEFTSGTIFQFEHLSSGLSFLFGSTGGYLFSFSIASFVVGLLLKNSSSLKKIIFALTIGNAIIFFCGVSWLYLFLGANSIGSAIMLGLIPFIPGEIIKMSIATGIIYSINKKRANSR